MTAPRPWLTLALAAALAGCAHGPTVPLGLAAGAPLAARAALGASFLRATAVPPAVLAAVQGPAQQAADEASRKRKIDFFALHGNPVGLRLGAGEGAGYVLSFLGSSKSQADLNIEMRALYGAG